MLFSAIALVAFTATTMAAEGKKDEKKDAKETKTIVVKRMDCVDQYHSTYYEYSQYLPNSVAEHIANSAYNLCKIIEAHTIPLKD